MDNIIIYMILGLVQGLLEWFPLSSSTHIYFLERFFGISDGVYLSASLHFGTLMAVFVYFGKDIVEIVREFFSFNFKGKYGRLGVHLLVASVPVFLTGLLFSFIFQNREVSLIITGLGLGVTAVLLFCAGNSFNNLDGTIFNIKLKQSFIVGIAQAFAVIPGISRSGA